MLAGSLSGVMAVEPIVPAATLSEKGNQLEARYAARLGSLKAAIGKAIPTIASQTMADYEIALGKEKTAQTAMDAVSKKLDQPKHYEGAIAYRSKVLRNIDAAIAAVEKKVSDASKEDVRDLAKKELADLQKGRADQHKGLVAEQAELEKAKASVPTILNEINAAKESWIKAKQSTRAFLTQAKIDAILMEADLDAMLAEYVILLEATPCGLAEFAQQGEEQAALVERMFATPALMMQMLVADGAGRTAAGKGAGPAPYGQAMTIYTDIQKASPKAKEGILQRLAMATALAHAVPIAQDNPAAAKGAPTHVDPVKRYLHYEKAFLAGELDPAFETLNTWDLRFLVDGNEPDETISWGREMLRNFHPDHVFNPDHGWRYVRLVSTDVNYGSGNVKYDRPELQSYQNILMNGGICGRRAFIGRFLLRSFGIPTIARPSRAHGALAHWTPNGWVVNLGPGWGAGTTGTPYKPDRDFLATTQARTNPKAYLQVKRAQWIGDAMGEARAYGVHGQSGKLPFWNSVSLYLQQTIIDDSKLVALDALGADLGEADAPAAADTSLAGSVTPADKTVTYHEGIITIPAAAFSKPVQSHPEVQVMKSFGGGSQVFLPRFGAKGLTILRGGGWKGLADGCKSGNRLLSDGYGCYNNWGFRAAMSSAGNETPKEITLDLGNGVKMEMVYIKPGTFTMGGENTKDGRFACVEVPHHEVVITKGYYLGKYEVTQSQFNAIMGENPSQSTKDPNCPADSVSDAAAVKFCELVAKKAGHAVRLPTEAEWEYACRAGSKTKWFFSDDPTVLGDYAWFKDNDGGKSHPVGQKKPNPWGLYDICGNVCERVSDRYDKDYYANGPKTDPTGPLLERKSLTEYVIHVPSAGRYTLTARVVTVNDGQQLLLSANDAEEVTMQMPFTCGKWQDSQPVTLSLEKGENTLRFWRINPPQQGLAVKSFTLNPIAN